jgi:FkbM family methyltransferase
VNRWRGDERPTVGAPISSLSTYPSAAVTISNVVGHIGELVPPAPQRCGRSPWLGAPRILIGELRGLLSTCRIANVELGSGVSIAADLRTAQGRRLYGYGFCEPAVRVMQALLRSGDAVIDAGANIGLYTLLAAARVGPGGCVIACEPSPATMSMLRENVDRNKLDWVQLREAALAEAPGRLPVHMLEPGSGSTSFAPADTTAGIDLEVEVTTVDEIAAGISKHISLVKVDVEGAELRVLRGAVQLLEGARPDFIIELEPDHLERQGCSVPELQAVFDDAAYLGYSIGDRLERISGPWRRPQGDPNILVRPRERANG